MNPTRKKFIALFLVFSLLEISCASITSRTTERRFPEKKRGAIVLTKKDGQQIEGELIAVKKNSLLVLSKWSGRDVSVDIEEIKVITIVKKSKAGKGALFGALAGVGGSVLAGILNKDVVEGMGVLAWTLIAGLLLVPIGALLGGFIGAAAGTDKKVQIEGMTDSEIREALDKLRKKARIRDYK